MKKSIQLIEKIVKEYCTERYSFNANLFDMGLVRSIRTEKDSKSRKEIIDAWDAIKCILQETRSENETL